MNPHDHATPVASKREGAGTGQIRLAALVTAYFPHSHADVLISRWFERWKDDREYGWTGPGTTIASLYIEQPGPWPEHHPGRRDVGVENARRYGVPLFSSVEDALTLGTGSLAVDGVLLIAEHGAFPSSPVGQKMYPRKQYFDRITSVFRASHRCVPVFVDKHFSWNYGWVLEMQATAREMGFALFGGSSIPHCPFEPADTGTADRAIEEVAILYTGPIESYGFHAFELGQSLMERRAGAVAGVAAITGFAGREMWQGIEDGRLDATMLDTAFRAIPDRIEGDIIAHLGRAQSAPGGGSPEFPAQLLAAGHSETTPVAALIEYVDGSRLTLWRVVGHLQRGSTSVFAGAIRGEGSQAPEGFRMKINGEHAPNFAALARAIDDFFTGSASVFVPERTVLASGLTEVFMHALAVPGVRLETPQLSGMQQVPELNPAPEAGDAIEIG